MTTRRSIWLVAMLACGVLIAGCGSSSSSNSQSSSTTSSSTSAASTAATPPAASGGGSVSAAVTAAVESCKQSIRAQPTLPASSKTKLEGVCAKAANGDTNAVKQAAREVCEEVIKTSAVPAGAAREQSLAACKTTTK